MAQVSRDSGVATMPADELQQYGRSKAQEIQERRKRRRLDEEKARADSKLKSVWAPKLWEQVRDEIRQRVLAINDALGEGALAWDETRAGLVVIKVARVPSNLSASYHPSNGSVTLTLNDHTETYDLEEMRGEVMFKAVGYFSAGQIAKMLVDKAAGMVF